MHSLMRWLTGAGGWLVAALLASMPLRAAEDPLLGDWAGGFGDGNDHVFLQLHFKAKDGGISGTYDAPLLFQQGRSLQRETKTTPSSVTFEIPSKPDAWFFSGEIKGDIISGQMKEGTRERPFQFARLALIKPESYVGTYEIEPGHFVFIRPAVEMGIGALQLMDFKTGRVAVLFPTSETSFFTGRADRVRERGTEGSRSLATFRGGIFRFSARLDASTDSSRAMKMDNLSLAGPNGSILDGCRLRSSGGEAC